MNSTPPIFEHAANMLDLVPEAYVRLDSGFRYTFVNRATEQLLGKDRAELLGTVLWEVYPALIGARFKANYRYVMAERTPVAFEDYYVPWGAAVPDLPWTDTPGRLR
jgi:PAS domain-containing protein